MTRVHDSRSGRAQPPRERADRKSGKDPTPSTDLQPEDAGTPDSGDRPQGTAAESAMKQTSKTGNEGGADTEKR